MMNSEANPAASVSVRPRRAGSKQAALLFVAATALVLLILGVIVSFLPRLMIGDGMEYYALFLAWADTLRPWMTDTSYHAYQALHESGDVLRTLPESALRRFFPALRLGAASDFNHFWLYSALAALVHGIVGLVGIHLGPHVSFLALHAALFVSLLGVAALCNGRAGYIAVLLMAFSSPLIWHFDKVHTEFYTFCLTTGAIALATRNQLVAGSILMAAAAAQNPGLSFVAVAMLAFRGLGGWKRLYSRWEVIGIVVAIALLAAHPVYYFLRYGVITPQILAGGASLGRDLLSAYIWLVDPDVGLFFSWPLGALLCIVGALVWRRTMAREIAKAEQWQLAAICGIFVLASLFSHASTENINSGGTPGVSRYALWYIAPIYPLALASVVYVLSLRRASRIVLALLALAACIGNGAHFLPQWDNANAPTPASRFIQRHFPSLYNPPAEVFLERYSGYGEEPRPIMAVVGPDCDKILILPSTRHDALATVPFRCPIVAQQLDGWARDISRSLKRPVFLSLSGAHAVLLPPPLVEVGKTNSYDPDTEAIRFIGWSTPEDTHRWSAAPISGIRLWLPATNERLCLTLDGSTLGQQTIKAVTDAGAAGEWQGEGPLALANIPLPPGETQVDVWLHFSNAHSPGPQDPRILAFSLKSLVVNKCP